MGHNLKILAEDSVLLTLRNRSACLELRENFHDHFSDIRPVYTKQEFLEMSDHWIAARKKYDELGQPEPKEQNIGLDQRYISGQPLHKDRVSLELTQGGSPEGHNMVHFHYDHLRLHMTENNFFQVATIFKEALMSYSAHQAKEISFSDPDITYSPVVSGTYASWLQEYQGGANPDDFQPMYLESKRLLRPADEQRYSDGWLKTTEGVEVRTAFISQSFNQQYLYTLLENIKKYGYGQGPYQYDYIRAQRTNEGKLLLTGSHRTACLLHLGYDKIKVIEVRGFEGYENKAAETDKL